jgi:hypothetical protein
MMNLPIISHKFYDKPSVFQPENLLREAKQQKESLQVISLKFASLIRMVTSRSILSTRIMQDKIRRGVLSH